MTRTRFASSTAFTSRRRKTSRSISDISPADVPEIAEIAEIAVQID
jgi:hypothetical protein